MRSLYLRIYLTVVLALALFAAVSGYFVQRHLESERQRGETLVQERVAAWAELLQRSLPGADAAPEEQAAALRDWSFRLRVPLALDDRAGQRIGAAESYLRREAEVGDARSAGSELAQRRVATPIKLEDGRTLWLMRPGMRPGMRAARHGGPGGPPPDEATCPANFRASPGTFFRSRITGPPCGIPIPIILSASLSRLCIRLWAVP